VGGFAGGFAGGFGFVGVGGLSCCVKWRCQENRFSESMGGLSHIFLFMHGRVNGVDLESQKRATKRAILLRPEQDRIGQVAHIIL
jgi:hypothetical protein